MKHNLTHLLSCFGNEPGLSGNSAWAKDLKGKIEISEPFDSVKNTSLELEFHIDTKAYSWENFCN
jgi:hypothetical protein